MSDGFVKSLFRMRKGNAGGQYLSWPAMGGAGVAGVTLTTGNAVWGAYTAVAAALAIGTEFWFAGMSCYSANTVQNYQVEWYNLTLTTIIAHFGFEVTNILNNCPPMTLPIPLRMAPGTAISARAGGAGNAKTIVVRFQYLVGV